jgi:NAD(P)H dehydrogenase (quinone)
MIINFHPKEIPSIKGLEVINKLTHLDKQNVVHVQDKTASEWKEIIKTDEKLLLVAPVYWWGGSYEFDKWIQDVFSYGFAFKYSENGMPEGLLNGRKFELHMTMGTPTAYATTMIENIKTRMEKGIFGFCNSEVEVFFYDREA